jgi:hypothetical protein
MSFYLVPGFIHLLQNHHTQPPNIHLVKLLWELNNTGRSLRSPRVVVVVVVVVIAFHVPLPPLMRFVMV